MPTIAVVSAPNIKPIIKIDKLFLILALKSKMINSTINAPIIAAISMLNLRLLSKLSLSRVCLLNKPVPITNSATPKPAPELMPSTDGPAIGFRNSVCINNPTTDKPIPVRIAVIDFGILKLNKMCCQVSFDKSLPKSPLSISLKGICTEPILILTNQKISKATMSSTKQG